ncbi:unnamed protein product [Tilletia controversa]|nr:hypothetical protein CF336_g1881 [Tilletia laevis]CAD6952285.1 unnamed protein product [Tilletia controversa]CAD6962410.1 unnamed protein product [Tilletia controversa]CAD6982679.1 unnamed protein product [Tilletia controversa]CAD7067779.1 unnamed protein product [Tilletia caries]
MSGKESVPNQSGSAPSSSQPRPPQPPSRGIVPSRGAAFAAGIGRGASRPPGPHFVPKRPQPQRVASPAAALSPAPTSAAASSSQPSNASASASGTGPSSSTAAARTGADRGGRGGGGRGARGRGGRGGGRGEAGAAGGGPRAPVEMTASGPFALGTGALRTLRNKPAVVAPILAPAIARPPTIGGDAGGNDSKNGSSSASASTPASGSTSASAPGPSGSSAKYNSSPVIDLDAPQYSSDGLRIIHMQDVPLLDERAPAVIPRFDTRTRNRVAKAKKPTAAVKKEEDMDEDDGLTPPPEVEEDDAVVDLDESDHEVEEPDQLASDFVHVDGGISPENRLLQFQIPRPFPSFVQDPTYVPPKPEPEVKAEPNPEADAENALNGTSAGKGREEDGAKPAGLGSTMIIPNRGETSSIGAPDPTAPSGTSAPSKPRRNVSFAPDTVGGPGSARDNRIDVDADEDSKKVFTDDRLWNGSPEGQIGELTIWRDGSVKLHFGNIVMNVSAALQHTFLQQVMALDDVSGKAYTLGEVQRKYIATPDIDYSLDDYEQLRREEDEADEKLRIEKEREQAERDRIAAEAAQRRKERAASGASAASGSKASSSSPGRKAAGSSKKG